MLILILSTGNQTLVGAGLGAFAGIWGIFYGLTATEFVRHGHYGFSNKQPERYKPLWWQRIFVVAISGVALITSVLYLIKHW